MKPILRIISIASLLLLIAPAFLFLAGVMSLPGVHSLMLTATVLWFACAVPQIRKNKENV